MGFPSNAKQMSSDMDGAIALMRLIQLRQMVSHRELSVPELAWASDRSPSYVIKVLSGYNYVKGTAQSFEQGMLLLDNAVSKLTRFKGYMCKCTKYEHKELERALYYG